MKHSLSARSGILWLLVVFGALIAASTVLAVRISREVSLVREYGALMDDLRIIAGDISENLDLNDPECFSYLEVTAQIQKDDKHFSYVLRDTAGTVLAPAFLVGKDVKMDIIRPVKSDGSAFIAEIWHTKCFVVRYAFSDRPLELLGIYDDQYVFGDVHYTVNLFIIILSLLFLALLLLAWFWIIPAIERLLAKKRRAESELNAARDLQQKAVTKLFPDEEGLHAYAVLQPAREVGGDIYRCMTVGDMLFFVMGDVSDKGMTAAYVMFLLSSVIQSHVVPDFSMTALMEELNTLLLDNPEYEMFCTMFMGTIDRYSLELEYCNAGHTKVIVDGEFLDQDPQLIAGVLRDFPYHTQKRQLARGARLLLYTDGVTEARDASGAFFGESRLLEWMQAQDPANSCEKTCKDLLDTLSAFRGKAEQNDDIAIMCIKL